MNDIYIPSTRAIPTRSSRMGETTDDLLQDSQHLLLLVQDCILSLNMGMHLAAYFRPAPESY